MIDRILAKFDGEFAENTIRAYCSDFTQYEKWCTENQLHPIPANAETLANYVDCLVNRQRVQLYAVELIA